MFQCVQIGDNVYEYIWTWFIGSWIGWFVGLWVCFFLFLFLGILEQAQMLIVFGIIGS